LNVGYCPENSLAERRVFVRVVSEEKLPGGCAKFSFEAFAAKLFAATNDGYLCDGMHKR